MTEATLTTWDAIKGEDDGRAVRKLFAGDGAEVKRIEIVAGATAGRHSHPFEQFVMVLEGEGNLDCAAGSTRLQPGCLIHFPADTWHSAVFETKTVLLEVNVNRAA